MPEEQKQEPNWQFNPDDQPQATIQPAKEPHDVPAVSWTAAEFIAHSKNAGWYILFIIAAVGVIAVVLLLTHDKISAFMLALVTVAFGVFAARKPKTLSYKIDGHGVTIGTKFFAWGQFKSFAIMEEGTADSIYLTPLKRFMPAVSMYFPPADADKILNVISNYLPHEERPPDLVDRFMHKIRF